MNYLLQLYRFHLVLLVPVCIALCLTFDFSIGEGVLELFAASVRSPLEGVSARPSYKEPSIERSAACLLPVTNYSAFPVWYKKRVLLPYEAVMCEIPRIAFVTTNGSRQHFTTDKKTGIRINASQPTCARMPEIIRLLFLGDFYQAFLDTPQLVPASTTPPVLFNQIVFYCIPLSAITLLAGLSLIRKLVRNVRVSHVYYYHVVVVITDMGMYVVNALDGVHLFGLLLLPICYCMNPVATPAWLIFSNETALSIIETFYCVGCSVQALVALDRYVALYYPFKFHKFFCKAFTIKAVLAVVLANIIVGTADFFSNRTIVRSLTNGAAGNVSELLHVLKQVSGCIRLAMLIVGLILQVIACTMVFIRMRLLLKRSSSAQSGLVTAGLAPCYLLFGTCVLSFVGTSSITAYLVLGSYPFVGSQPSNKRLVAAWRKARYAVTVTTPICSGLAFYIHCLSSAQYRRLLAKTKLVVWCTKKLGIKTKNSTPTENNETDATTNLMTMA